MQILSYLWSSRADQGLIKVLTGPDTPHSGLIFRISDIVSIPCSVILKPASWR